jgi:hypothetical protein
LERASRRLGRPIRKRDKPRMVCAAVTPFTQCWSRFIRGPSDGYLDREETRELTRILGDFACSEDCFFRFPEILFIGTDVPLTFHGRFCDLEPSILKNPRHFTPEYWWPQDHSWCVCSDYDLTFTIVGGKSELISAVLSSERLECLEVNAGTRVDSLIPMPAF